MANVLYKYKGEWYTIKMPAIDKIDDVKIDNSPDEKETPDPSKAEEPNGQ